MNKVIFSDEQLAFLDYVINREIKLLYSACERVDDPVLITEADLRIAALKGLLKTIFDNGNKDL